MLLSIWFFTKGVYRSIYSSALEVFYLLNIFFLSIVILAIGFIGPIKYQNMAIIISSSLSFVVCLVTIAIHLWWSFDLKKMKRRLGFTDRRENMQLPQLVGDENEEDISRSGSPLSIVYGSHRGEHQFVLEFPHPHDELESSSPVLLVREPLLFDT